MAMSLNLTDLSVESFINEAPGDDPGLMSESYEMGGCGTHSLNYATHCDCSGGPRCTLACVEYSQATEYDICCG